MSDFSTTRRQFHLPAGITYLDGNSLGPLPLAARERARAVLDEQWGELLIGAWNGAGWMDLPRRVGERIARLIGAPPGTVSVGDTLTVKVYQALSAALALRPERRVVLSDSGNFPSDLYAAQGLIERLGGGRELRVVAPEAVAEALDDEIAVLLLTQVDYRSGRLHDMRALTERAHAAGALVIWDLAHSAGALPLAVADCGVDLAVGCSYKYLNGGPGAPAFIYADAALTGQLRPDLRGWLGHAEPFAFERNWRPAAGVERLRIGTPPVLQLAVLEAALEVWEGVDMARLRARSIELSQRFIAGVEASCPQLALASPRDPAARGSQVSFAFAEGYAAMQALIARGVIGDFRAPDLMRFGFTPLYLDAADIDRAVAVLAEVLNAGEYRDGAPLAQGVVT